MKNPDRLVRNDFARAAEGAIDSPHRTSPHWFGDEFDFQQIVTSLTYALQQHIAFQWNLGCR